MVAYGCEMVVAQNCQVVCLRNLIYIWATKVLYVNEAWRWLEAANIKQTQPIVSFFQREFLVNFGLTSRVKELITKGSGRPDVIH